MRAHNVEIDLSKEYLMALLVFEIWNPDKVPKHPIIHETRKSTLVYRTRGVVGADRALNGEFFLDDVKN